MDSRRGCHHSLVCVSSPFAGPAADAGDAGYEDADAIDSPAYEDGGTIAFVPGASASASVYNHLFSEDGTAAGAGSGAAAR